jgi:Tol biopolymer transport system component
MQRRISVGGRAWVVATGCVLLAMLAAVPPTANAAFPGQNGKLVLLAGNSCLYTIDPDGSNLQQISDACSFSNPVWSPDGKKIAYAYGDIHVINADGSGDTNVTSGVGQGGEHDPSWSPDGTRIAYEQATIDPETNLFEEHVWTSNVDGTNHVRLAPSMCKTLNPLWHPDGTRIAFDGYPTVAADGYCYAPDRGKWLINPDGSGQVPLPTDGIDSWSPDGSMVAFSPSPSPCGGRSESCQVYVQPADGATPATPVGPVGGRKPRWSPDGKKLAFLRATAFGQPSYLWTMNADGTEVTLLTTFEAVDVDWQPIPGPKRSDFKNAAKFCKAEREFLGDSAFRQKYGGGANAYGKCVSGK